MVLCVTGPMAAGKNFASSVLEKKGFVSIDADLAGHDAVEICSEKIIAEFSALAEQKKIPLVDAEKKIIRKNLGALIFGDAELVKKQEQIVFPYIDSVIGNFIDENTRKNKNVVVNATVLFKIPSMKKIDFVLYVDSFFLIRLLRAKKRDGGNFKNILSRFKSQKNLLQNYRRTEIPLVRIFNSGGKNSLEKKIEKFLLKNSSSVL